MDLRLSGQSIFVTGGSRGIGKATVIQLLEEGALVATCARNKTALENIKASLPPELQNHLLIHEADILDEVAINEAVKDTIQKFGKLDGIVANAGAGAVGDLFTTPSKTWNEQYNIKVFGVLNLVKAATPFLKEATEAKIVIINGVTADNPDLNMAAVSVARAAVANLAKILTRELAENLICVNTINLGAIDTDRQKEKYQKASLDISYGEWVKTEATRREIPFKRFGQPEEVAALITFLLSPLSSYITGSFIDISGGMKL